MKITDNGWTLFDWDAATGRSTWFMEDGNKTHWRVDYPVEATISENAAIRNVAQKAWKGDYHLIASIPLNILHDENAGLMKAHSEGDDKYVSRWLNDGDNRAWRTRDGRV
ncbi:hypothetical protein O9X81_05215 [Agrobacterium salinitolerans]|uniref:hypothetical protein n=1 Tax=Agrobacterium salinitolerans TaxID=1183413 RepID=UPI0022B82894|nr:hypothetical protein [Agrobacterium salinitolerans]MCZ7856006.1 hypothetical protein [Agrobacterium salinitolerans]